MYAPRNLQGRILVYLFFVVFVLVSEISHGASRLFSLKPYKSIKKNVLV